MIVEYLRYSIESKRADASAKPVDLEAMQHYQVRVASPDLPECRMGQPARDAQLADRSPPRREAPIPHWSWGVAPAYVG